LEEKKSPESVESPAQDATSVGAESGKEETQGGSGRERIFKRRWKSMTLVGVVLAALLLGYWWVSVHNRVSTDDAYVHADNAQISSRIPGTVWKLFVDNNEPVKAGQVLLQLDPADYKVALDKAEATLAESEADVQASEVSVSLTDVQTAAEVQAAQAAFQAAQDKEKESRHKLAELVKQRTGVEAELVLAKSDFERFSNLYRQGAGSERRSQEAGITLKKAQSQLDSLDAQIAAAQSSVSAIIKEVERSAAQLEAAKSARSNVAIQKHKLASLIGKRDKAKADLEAAKLNLSYCTITAPIKGYIAQRTIQLGDRVLTGEALMAVVPLQDVYIEANFKETQLTYIRVGQPATIHADIYPAYTYRGEVIGIGSGTGAAFSLLPPENATGNWIKVVRRVPVKIRLSGPIPADYPLRIGLSLEVDVDISNKNGPLLIPESAVTSTEVPTSSAARP
jgi:membrane fusion protein (multidrug efflux system)